MTAQADFISLVQSLNPVMGRMFIHGRIETLDIYNRATNLYGTSNWAKKDNKYGIDLNPNGLVVVTDGGSAPELSVTEGTIFSASINGFKPKTGFNTRILCKRDAISTSFELYMTSSVQQLILFYGSTYTSAPLSYYQRTVGVTFTNGQVPLFYSDGQQLGVASGVAAITPNTANLNIGCFYSNGYACYTPITISLLFNTQLTPEQISDLDYLFSRLKGVDSRDPVRSVVPVDLSPEGITDTETFSGLLTPDGKLLGKRGVSLGTKTGRVEYSAHKNYSDGIQIGRGGSCSLSNASSLLNKNVGAIEVVFTPDIISGTPYVVNCDLNVRNRLHIDTGALSRWYALFGNPATTINGPSGSAKVGVASHLILTWWTDGADKYCEFFVNGVSAGSSIFTGDSAATVLEFFGSSSVFYGKFHYGRIYPSRITPAQAASLYSRIATKLVERQCARDTYPISLASVTTDGMVGPWRRGSGQWQWQDDGAKRKLVCISSGYCYDDSNQAFGAWYFRVTKGSETTTPYVVFIASDKTAYTSATQNGYMFGLSATEQVIIFRVTAGGAPSAPIVSAANYVAIGVEYEFFLTRSNVGLFTLYIRGGVYTTWTLVGSGTDTTYTTSKYVVADIDTSDTISEYRTYPMGQMLLPGQCPGLEDV